MEAFAILSETFDAADENPSDVLSIASATATGILESTLVVADGGGSAFIVIRIYLLYIYNIFFCSISQLFTYQLCMMIVARYLSIHLDSKNSFKKIETSHYRFRIDNCPMLPEDQLD